MNIKGYPRYLSSSKRLFASGAVALLAAMGIAACTGTVGDEPAKLATDVLASVEKVSLEIEGMT